MIERWIGRAALFSAVAMMGCGEKSGDGGGGNGGTTTQTGGTGATAGSSGTGGNSGTGGTGAGSGGAPTGGSGANGGLGGDAGMAGGGASGMAGGGMGGDAGQAGAAGMAGMAPENLSETGLFSLRGTNGELVLMPGVREFQPRYWLWSDGADKKRYIYLPTGTKIDTTDVDHWVFPVGTKLWKSFISGTQLVETRLIEILGPANQVRYTTYAWMTADATDAQRMNPRDQWLNAAGTMHDIPNSQMCDRCHNALRDHVLGFSALQLNHNMGGLNLEMLNTEQLLTTAVPTTIAFPGADQATRDAVGYFHANCGNCHNDSPGLPVENIPEPQMHLRVLVANQMLEDTGLWQTAVNQRITGSNELGVDYRIRGGDIMQSQVHVRMNLRMVEDQMPPIGTEMQDMMGLMAIDSWIMSLPPPQ